jgi:predicted nucleotidyltransferase
MNEELINTIRSTLSRHNVRRAGLFGSFESDVDLLVDLDPEISLLDFVALKLELQDVLTRNVDLVEYSTIKSLLRDTILAEQIVIL